VPAAAVPVLFLHLRYQPKAHFGFGSTSVGIELSDVAVLVVVGAAVLCGLREGWAPLRPARWLWLAGGLLLGFVVAATLYPLAWQEDYRFLKHLVTAAKFVEYGLLAPALPLLLRRHRAGLPLLWSIVAWSLAASGWGLLQFAGLVSEFEGERPLQREPSFVGIHDFAALSGAAFVLSLAVFALRLSSPPVRALGILAAAGGAVGLVLAGAVTAALGVVLGGLAVVGIARARGTLTGARFVSVLAAVAVVALGVSLMRSGEVAQFIRERGIGSRAEATGNVESYVQRSLLAYIGLRIFVDHPVVGVGWQGSEELENYSPYLGDAHRRYPSAPEEAFPSPAHAWGVQNAYLQALADLGVVGLVLLLVLLGGGVVLGARAATRAPPDVLLPAIAGPLWLLVAVGVWNGEGLVAGIPLDALTWLGVGVVAAALGWTSDVHAD
jgi:hypothetical protein